MITGPGPEVKAAAGVPAVLHKIPTTYDPKPCPRCGSENHTPGTRRLSWGSTLSHSDGLGGRKGRLRLVWLASLEADEKGPDDVIPRGAKVCFCLFLSSVVL